MCLILWHFVVGSNNRTVNKRTKIYTKYFDEITLST